jgi:hypothetical protein
LYHIYNINNELEPGEVITSLSQIFNLEYNQISSLLTGIGLAVNIFKEDDEYETSIFNSQYPDICISFRIDKFENYEAGMNTMLKMVIWLMSYLKEDMRLSLNEDQILQRISGNSNLNNESDFWIQPKLYFPNQNYQSAQV